MSLKSLKLLSLDLYIVLKNEVSRQISSVGSQVGAQATAGDLLTLPHTSNKRKKILGQHSAETRKNLIF